MYNRLPDLTLEYKNLYPNSHTSVRFVREDGLTIDSLFSKPVEVEPGEVGAANFLAANLDDHITEAGTYRMEIVHVSPFERDGIVLDSITLRKKTDVTINATVGNSE